MRNTIAFFIAIIVSASLISPVFAQSSECKKPQGASKEDLQKIISACSAQVESLSKQRTSLSSQIQYMDSQISLTNLKIQENEQLVQQLEKEIAQLGTRISELDVTLTRVGDTATKKLEELYKQNRSNVMIHAVTSSNTLQSMLRTMQYMKIAQKRDRELLLRLQDAKVSFSEQKNLREEKEVELEETTKQLANYKAGLSVQQEAKRSLLEITRNDEARYQGLLAEARAESEALSAIIAGNGNEGLVSDVTKGTAIASIIAGASCNSSGTHLHFSVERGGGYLNPFDVLKPIDLSNQSGDSYGLSGSWDWPMDPPIRLNQGYGSTVFSRISGFYGGGGHNGIDIEGAGYTVRAVSDGTLYRGSYRGWNGCMLPYVKLKHKDSDITTYYLHVR